MWFLAVYTSSVHQAFWPFLLSLELLDDAEFETNDVLGEDGLVTFISVEISCMRSNLQWVPNRINSAVNKGR